jgi:hypothetical protein
MTADDVFLLSLPTDSMQCFGMGVANPDTYAKYPIPHQYILDKAEIADIRNHVNQYNGIIMNTATVYNLAYVDMNQVLIDVGNGGIMVDGYEFTSTFVQGNTFSLDGIHLTTAGNAMVAHYFIKAINATYGATLPQVIITDYYGVTFP